MSKRMDLTKQLIYFGIVGVTTLVIDVAVTTFSFSVLHWQAYLASGAGFLAGFAFNFPMNRKKVFKHTEQDRFNLKTQILFYSILCLFNLFMTSFLAQVLVSLGILISYTKILITAVISSWNFILFKTLIFSKKNNDIDNAIDERTLGSI